MLDNPFGRHSRRRSVVLSMAAGLLTLGSLATGIARAQAGATDFPNHLVRIVPFGAGGGPIDGI